MDNQPLFIKKISTDAQPFVASGSLLRASMGLCVITLMVFGLAYSAATTQLGQLVFPEQANGSLVYAQGKPVGSMLVAQPVTSNQYFKPRPSAAGYNLMAMAGSNQARTNPDLQKRIDKTLIQVIQQNNVSVARMTSDQIPGDIVTQSGSGIDPDISPQAARIQVNRIAKARQLKPELVSQLVEQQIQAPQFGILGAARVNVLQLNLALDEIGRQHDK